MTVLTVTATERADTLGISISSGIGGNKSRIATTELAAASSSSTIDFFRVPTNARILYASRIYNDDLATSGSPTLSLGLIAVNGNVTSLDTALTSGASLSAASTTGTGTPALADFASAGKRAWELTTSPASTDPGGDLIVRGTVRGGATTATGTITVEIIYALE